MYEDYDVIIVGCGLSGCTLAERFANILNKKVIILEKRSHIGGNCYDYIDNNGILVNMYGAHLFHTNIEPVWDYINCFDKWIRWEHKVVGLVDQMLVPIPVNITTVNMVCGENIINEGEMNTWLEKTQVKYDNITNSMEIAKSRVGEKLYDKIFKDYTYKQWNKYPEELKPEVLGRIPIRNNFDDRYFSDRYQALPHKGYTHFFEKLISSDNIKVELNVDFLQIKDMIPKNKIIIYTGPIDSYFSNSGYEKLEYRSIKFVKEDYVNMNYYQSNSVVNYPESNVDFTRIVEYKHFLNQKSPNTTIVREYTTDIGDPYYPVLNEKNQTLYNMYKNLADEEMKINNIHFIGRLANYKYFNMDMAIMNALDYFNNIFI
jgi:UDP-galactopyranose mutase